MRKLGKNLRRTGDVKAERTSASGFYTKHVPCLHGLNVNTRHSMASHFLAARLLRSAQLRCSCQGPESVTRLKSSLHQVRCRLSTANVERFAAISNAERIRDSLRSGAQISHPVSELIARTAHGARHRAAERE